MSPGMFFDMGDAGYASIELQIHDACGMMHTSSKSHLELHVNIAGPNGGPVQRQREREREREREGERREEREREREIVLETDMDEGSRRARKPLKYFSDIVIACLPVIDLSDFVTNLRTRSQKRQHTSAYVSTRPRTSANVMDLSEFVTNRQLVVDYPAVLVHDLIHRQDPPRKALLERKPDHATLPAPFCVRICTFVLVTQ